MKGYHYFQGWYYISKSTPVRVYAECNIGPHRVTKKEALDVLEYAKQDAETWLGRDHINSDLTDEFINEWTVKEKNSLKMINKMLKLLRSK